MLLSDKLLSLDYFMHNSLIILTDSKFNLPLSSFNYFNESFCENNVKNVNVFYSFIS
jgi:hypothetical protein